jgi:hypothetical protein
LSLFLMTCKTSSTGTLVNWLATSKLRRWSSFWRLIFCIDFIKCLSPSRRRLCCQLEGSGSYGGVLLGHNRESVELIIGLSGTSGLCILESP